MAYHTAIDVDRGVSMRQVVKFDDKNPHKFEADTKFGGITVYMYKDTPGEYYDVHGNKVPEGIAKLAGFEIDKLARARRKREAMKEFEKKLAAELAMETEDEIEILAEAGDWQVIGMPASRAKIVDKTTGDVVTHVPMPRPDALELLKQLVAASDDGSEEPATTASKGAKNGSSQA